MQAPSGVDYYCDVSLLFDTNPLQTCRGPQCDKLQTARGGLSSTRRQLINHFAVGINAVILDAGTILPQFLDDLKTLQFVSQIVKAQGAKYRQVCKKQRRQYRGHIDDVFKNMG